MTDLTEITVIGGDKTGLIANVTTLLFERGINVEDLDQAVRDGIFRMTLHADTSEMVCTEETLRDALSELGDELGVDVQVRFPSDRETQQIAVLTTKESHCLEALFEAWTNDELGADISVVIGNRDSLEPLASQYDVPFHDIGDEKGSPDEDELLELLEQYDVDLIVLARYMRILSPNVVFRYEDRIINIHPSLLPAFPGAAAYRQAKEEGVRIAGVTAHYVTTDLDQGPIITQRAFDVPDDASVEEIKELGQPLEADALLEAVQLHLDGAVSVHRGRTSVREDADESEYQLGMTKQAREANPDRPVDGLGDALADAPESADEDDEAEATPEPSDD
ncbi:formyltetrahydrofolate deformylase [Halopelagius longus]|uniref:Formyltetrahydrofolate deformylase n=1 Tax=Halopelagius longus TaxID=1236180 RepID=A0A1H0Y2V1_9EURY|nr:formyltetrahydrofolate deformylase [Halopelagius longus]RDI72244.1 formyltetrahydrofolate deformylase [Halopelagius longus]SDQ09423.1 formyltetrahydrofolate deformylase [Halopelagius longus]